MCRRRAVPAQLTNGVCHLASLTQFRAAATPEGLSSHAEPAHATGARPTLRVRRALLPYLDVRSGVRCYKRLTRDVLGATAATHERRSIRTGTAADTRSESLDSAAGRVRSTPRPPAVLRHARPRCNRSRALDVHAPAAQAAATHTAVRLSRTARNDASVLRTGVRRYAARGDMRREPLCSAALCTAVGRACSVSTFRRVVSKSFHFRS